MTDDRTFAASHDPRHEQIDRNMAPQLSLMTAAESWVVFTGAT